jgi:hypothetical protein
MEQYYGVKTKEQYCENSQPASIDCYADAVEQNQAKGK